MIDADTLAAYRCGVETGVMKSATPNVVRELLDEIDRLREELCDARHGVELAESEIVGLRREVELLYAGQPEVALAAAEAHDERYGGMAGIRVFYHPYQCVWIAKADWSSGKLVQVEGPSAAESVRSLVAQLGAEGGAEGGEE